MTRLLAATGLSMGLDVISSETHGMAMRGGAVISHLKVGPSPAP
jgi:indolepyruvate ferredoxin oxidoreductase beta subunit